MQELVDGVRAHILNGRIVRQIYSVLGIPPPNGQKPADVERVTTDADLANLIGLAEGAYKRLLFQLRLTKAEQANQSPPPDAREYFAGDEFIPIDDPYDRVASDSENDLYLKSEEEGRRSCGLEVTTVLNMRSLGAEGKWGNSATRWKR